MRNLYSLNAVICFAFIFLTISTSNAQTLQTVTNSGRTTSNWIQITDQLNVLTSGSGLELYGASSNGEGYINAYDRTNNAPKNLRIQQGGGNTIMNAVGGYVGIGTASPSTYLSVYKSTASLIYGTYPSTEVNNPNTSGSARSLIALKSGTAIATGVAGLVGGLESNASSNTGQYLWVKTYASSYPVYIGFSQSDLMIKSGNVGIGTTDTKGYKLAVNGSAIFTSVKVELYANWSDYVFEPAYKLRSLQSVEEYINQYKHLPDVPSATEIKENGIDLGQNQALLLKKIEELTLYLIELKKENEQIKDELQKLSEKK